MTDSVTANPALALQVLTQAPGASAQPAALGASAGPAGASPGAPDAAFSALLLGLRASPGSPAASAGASPEPGACLAQATLEGINAARFSLPAAETTIARLPPATESTGELLPEGGNDLPLPDVQALLASLEQLPAESPAPASNPLQAATSPAVAGLPAPGSPDSTSEAGLTESTGLQLPATSTNLLADLQQQGQSRAEQSQGTAMQPGGATERAGSDPLNLKDAALPVSDGMGKDGGDTGTSRGMDLALPTEFRARLEAALALASRPAVAGVDAGASNGISAAFATTPATPSLTSLPVSSASMPTYLPPLQPLADNSAWSQGLGERLMMMVDKGLQTATLRLQPEHLGPVEIQLNVDEQGSTQILFSAHSAQTRDALESAIPRLRELFSEQGLNLMQANVDSGGGSAFAQRGFAAEFPFWNRWARDAGPADETGSSRGWQAARVSDRRLDVLV